MVIIVYRIGVGIYYFIFCTLDLATKNISLIILFDQAAAAYLFLSFKRSQYSSKTEKSDNRN